MIIEKEKKEQDRQKSLARRAMGIWIRNTSELNDKKYKKYYDLVELKIRKEKELDELIKEHDEKEGITYELSPDISNGRYKYKTENMANWRSITILAVSKNRSFIIVFDDEIRSFYRLSFNSHILLKKRKRSGEKERKKRAFDDDKKKHKLGNNKKKINFKRIMNKQ